MDISSKLRKVISDTAIILHYIGVDFTKRDYRISKWNILPTFLVVFYLISTPYTIINSDEKLMWQCFALTGVGAQVRKFWLLLHTCS
jgi:hypothetical protein